MPCEQVVTDVAQNACFRGVPYWHWTKVPFFATSITTAAPPPCCSTPEWASERNSAPRTLCIRAPSFASGRDRHLSSAGPSQCPGDEASDCFAAATTCAGVSPYFSNKILSGAD